MARNEKQYRVPATSVANRTSATGEFEVLSEIAVAASLTSGDRSQRFPHTVFELGAGWIKLYFRQSIAVTVEVTLQAERYQLQRLSVETRC